MKNITVKLLLTSTLTSLLFSSCYKKFDEKSYAPPLNIGGYTSTKEIGTGHLVGYWAFNGSLIDSVSGTVGVNTGTSFTSGIKGQALQTAANAYVVSNTPAALQNLHSFTTTMWVNAPLNSTGIAGLMDIANGNSFWGNLTIFFENGGTATSGVLKIHVNNSGTDAWLGNYTLASPWGKWMSVAVTYDAATSTFKVFVNGSKIATQPQAGYGSLTFQNATKMVFGTVQFQTTPSLTTATGSQGWADYLKGQLDEVRVYDIALSESDVNALVKLEGRGK